NPSRDAFVQDLTAAAALARTPMVATKAAARLNALNTPDDLARKIMTRANVAANTVEITTVPYASAAKARQLADAFAAELAGSLSDQQDTLATRASDASSTEQQSTAACEAAARLSGPSACPCLPRSRPSTAMAWWPPANRCRRPPTPSATCERHSPASGGRRSVTAARAAASSI